jgi:hypothetical protein
MGINLAAQRILKVTPGATRWLRSISDAVSWFRLDVGCSDIAVSLKTPFAAHPARELAASTVDVSELAPSPRAAHGVNDANHRLEMRLARGKTDQSLRRVQLHGSQE